MVHGARPSWVWVPWPDGSGSRRNAMASGTEATKATPREARRKTRGLRSSPGMALSLGFIGGVLGHRGLEQQLDGRDLAVEVGELGVDRAAVALEVRRDVE